MKGELVTKRHSDTDYCHTRSRATAASDRCVVLPGSEGEGHEDALDSGAGRGQAELHSPVIDQVELNIPTIQIHKADFRHMAS